MITNQWFLYAIAAGVTLLIAVVALVGYMVYKRTSKEVAYDNQLQELIGDENVTRKVTYMYRWNQYWSKLFKEAGWARYNDDAGNAGRDVLFVGIGLMLIISLLFRSVILGPFVVIVFGVVIVALLKFRIQKEQQKISTQLPGFLAALKANIQANSTPERAILKVVDDMPSPLYDDLYVSKQQILANTPFNVVIKDLSKRTKSKDLKFLCACILQAISSGANLESQIGKIQEVLEERQKSSDALSKAISSVTPSIYVASVAIPFTFFALYILNDVTREYWFVDPTSWLGLLVVLLLWGAGIWLSKKQVDKIRNL